MLEICLMGGFDARRSGASLRQNWPRSTDRLLALLTIYNNQSLHDEWVTMALNIPESVLPQSISALYEVLAEDRKRIHHQNRRLYLDTNGIKVDLFDYERQIASRNREHCKEALLLYRGGLLKGWQAEGWFEERYESCLCSFLEVVRRFSKEAVDAGAYDLAASYLRRYVHAYPEMDAVWTELVHLYTKFGQGEAIETTRRRYLEALEKRAIDEGRVLLPSALFLAACQSGAGAQTAASFPSLSAPALPALNEQVSPPPAAPANAALLEPVGGVVPIGSPFYLERPQDRRLLDALSDYEMFLLVKGARQVGKSSLLTRAIQSARDNGAQVVLSDWQKIPQSSLADDPAAFLFSLADTFAEQLERDISLKTHVASTRSLFASFERFLLRDVLRGTPTSLLWVIDEADHLFGSPFQDAMFGMLRSWTTTRALDMTGEWQKLKVIIAYATEPYLFIKNLNQSPFNIGAPHTLNDFSGEQVREMNRRYGSPLSEREVEELYAIVGGHPYLVRRCLREICSGGGMQAIRLAAEQGADPFSDHLHRMWLALQRDPEMSAALKAYFRDGAVIANALCLRLRAGGVLTGESPETMRPRCGLYDAYLRRMLL